MLYAANEKSFFFSVLFFYRHEKGETHLKVCSKLPAGTSCRLIYACINLNNFN